MVGGTAATHQTYSPEFAGEVAESASNFDIIFVEQLGADGGIIKAGGELYGVEHGQAILRGDDKLKTQLFQPVAEQLVISAMAFKTGV